MITQYKKEAFKEAFNALATNHLLRHMPGHVYWKDCNGVVFGCNQEQAESLGYKSPEEVIGKTHIDFFDEETAERHDEFDRKVREEKRAVEGVERVGESEYFLSKKAPIEDRDGNVVGIIGVSINVTKQQRIENELRQKTQELDASVKVLNIVSHEMKNTLQGMLGISEEILIAWDKIKDEDKKTYFRDVLNSRDRLMLFLEDILEVAKLRSGILKFAFSECSIREILKKIASEYNRAPTVVSLDISEDIPETIYCDQSRVQQVLDNLLRNAIRYGGQDQQIIISASTSANSKDFVKVTVQDKGIGVPEDEAELVFQSFYESSLTRNKKGSIGLGLSICKEIIDAHRGMIWVEPNQTQGAMFSFTMPTSHEAYSRHAKCEKQKTESL